MNDRWGRRLFTTGAGVLVLLGLIHSLSLFGKPVPANDTERQLQDLMANYQFNLMGSMRTMDSFLRGFSISFMLAALCLGALDLAVMRENLALVKRVALINVLWLAAMTAVSLRYFFIFPTACLASALLIFALARVKLRASF